MWRGVDRQRAGVILRARAADETAGDHFVFTRVEIFGIHFFMWIAAIAGIERGTIRFQHSEDLIVPIGAVPFDTERELGVRVRDVRSCRHVDRRLVLIRQRAVGEIRAIAGPVYARRNTSRPSDSDFLVRCRRHGYRARGRVGHFQPP